MPSRRKFNCQIIVGVKIVWAELQSHPTMVSFGGGGGVVSKVVMNTGREPSPTLVFTATTNTAATT